MGKSDRTHQAEEGGQKNKRKSKSRMSYLKEVRRGGGGGGGYRRGGGGRGGDYVSAYDRNGQVKKHRQYLGPGMRGFLLTTNFRENDCVREGYNVLNEYYRPEDEMGEGGDSKAEAKEAEPKSEIETASSSAPVMASGAAADHEDDDDIDAALDKEIKQLRNDRSHFKFQSVDTGVKNIVFIKTTLKKPTEIMYRIFEDVVTKMETKSRNILRFIPIEGTCRTDDQSVRQLAKEIFTPYFSGGYKSFKVIINIRHNSKFSKEEIIKTLGEVVDEINPLNVVNLTDPEYTILVEVIKSTLCLSVLKDFIKYKKYNITEIVSPTPVAPPKSTSAEQGGEDKKAVTEIADPEGQDTSENPPSAEKIEMESAASAETSHEEETKNMTQD